MRTFLTITIKLLLLKYGRSVNKFVIIAGRWNRTNSYRHAKIATRPNLNSGKMNQCAAWMPKARNHMAGSTPKYSFSNRKFELANSRCRVIWDVILLQETPIIIREE